LKELLQLIHYGDRQEVWSDDQGAQERSGFFNSWYTDPSLQGKGEQITHKSAITASAVE